MTAKAYPARGGHFAATAAILFFIYVIFPDSFFYYFSWTAHVLLYALLATVTYPLCKHVYDDEKIEANNKAVLITGCDSGFGNELAKRLDSKGFHVFASCLFINGSGATDLKRTCSNRLRILYLDVTKDDTVEQAVRYVMENLRSNVLWAVVNNAGTVKGFSTDICSMEAFKDTIDVNALGPVRVTKAFLPLLKKSKGRIVNVTSVVGRISPVDACAYAMSKHAAVAFTECLSQEMIVWGVRVISIEPEAFRTGLTNTENILKILESASCNVSEDIRSSYGKEYFEKLKKVFSLVLSFSSPKTYIVVDAIEAAITEKNPEHVYKPRHNLLTWAFYVAMEYMPYELFEMQGFYLMKILGYPTPKAVKDDHSN